MWATPEGGREPGQPPEITRYWGHWKAAKSLFFTTYGLFFKAGPAAAAGSVLALDQTCDMPSSNNLVMPHRPSFNSPLPPACWFGKALSSLLNLLFFLVENKTHLPIQCRLDLLASQRPCKLLIQIFAVTLGWKKPHLAHSTSSCLNSSTQFICFSYKIVIPFKFAWSEPRKL